MAKVIARNKNLQRNYFVLKTMEAGIVLTGTEIKSVRAGKVALQDAYCGVKKQQMLLIGMHIAPYFKGNIFNHAETRDRVLLLHKKEIVKLASAVAQNHLTIIPEELYLVKGLAKVKIALCRGKKLYDKRRDIKNRELKREMNEFVKGKGK